MAILVAGWRSDQGSRGAENGAGRNNEAKANPVTDRADTLASPNGEWAMGTRHSRTDAAGGTGWTMELQHNVTSNFSKVC